MERLATVALVLLAWALLAGCARYADEWMTHHAGSGAQSQLGARQASDGVMPREQTQMWQRHVVKRGETVSGLAERYGVSMQQIIRQNRLKPPYHIYVGQVLDIGPIPPANSRLHRVARGETLPRIAKLYGVRVADILAANPGLRPDRLVAGQRLRIPEAGGQPPEALAASAERRRAEATGELEALPPISAEAYRRAAEMPAPPLSGQGFLWPVEGEIIDRFGAKPNGMRNDGVNIAAPVGTPVRAAESGVVVYAGEAVPAFGRMLMLRHDGGWLTAYAHNATLLVTVGDIVRRGQVIARVGATGDVPSPQLHFQIRKGTEPVDPVALLKPTRQLAQR